MSLWDYITDWLGRDDKPVTPLAVEPVDPVAVPSGDLIAAGAFARPAVGVSGGVLTVAAEGAGMGSIWVYRLKDGKWQGGLVVQGSDQTADRVYVPDVAGGVVSFRFGPKTGGTWKGPGLVLPNNNVIRTQLTTGAARLAADGQGVILMSKDSNYGRVNADGSIGQRGRFASLSPGEKIGFDVEGDTWAVAMGGYSVQDASVAIGKPGAVKVYPVAAYRTYPAMSSDLLYVSVCLNGADCWFATVYGGRLMVNRVSGGKVRFPTGSLKAISPCNDGDRCPPRLVRHKGRVVAVWQSGGTIYRVDVEKAVKGKEKPAVIAQGSQPAACSDGSKMYIVYVSGGLRIKIME